LIFIIHYLFCFNFKIDFNYFKLNNFSLFYAVASEINSHFDAYPNAIFIFALPNQN